MRTAALALVKREGVSYPSSEHAFAPSVPYPEYGGALSGAENPVYDMVREGFRLLRMDEAHLDTPQWNPLGDIIRPGDTVLLKPNLVHHFNPAGTLESMLTHPSVLRAVLDYAFLAAGDAGRIIIGDAPVQSCDFSAMLHAGHYDVLEEYYAGQGRRLCFADLRARAVTGGADGVLKPAESARACMGAKEVRLDEKSAYHGLPAERLARLRVTNYVSDELFRHHQPERHEYLISDACLLADVVIDLPKPKTHRKAGITGAMKNLIGVNASKAYLPHHTLGAKEEGGDEYLAKSRRKALFTRLQERIDRANAAGRFSRVLPLRLSQELILLSAKLFPHRDSFTEGSWYGNETLPRTIADILYAVRFADRNGSLRDTPQRRLFVIADMITAGAGEGPLRPVPYPLHTLLMGEDPAMMDLLIARLFGLPEERIPSIALARDPEREAQTTVYGNLPEAAALPLPSFPCAGKQIPLPKGWAAP